MKAEDLERWIGSSDWEKYLNKNIKRIDEEIALLEKWSRDYPTEKHLDSIWILKDCRAHCESLIYEELCFRRTVDRWYENLNTDEKQIVNLRFKQGLSWEAIAIKTYCSYASAFRILKRALARDDTSRAQNAKARLKRSRKHK